MKKFIYTIIAVLTAVNFCYAGTGEISGEFLLMPVGPKAYALGSSMVADGNEPLSLFYNPANSASFEAASVSLGQTYYLIDSKIEYFAFSVPITNESHIGIGVNVFYTEPIDVYTWDSPEKSNDQYDVSYNSFVLNYALELSPKIFFGINGKLYKEEIANIMATTTLFDFGFKLNLGGKGAVGVAVQNLGKGLTFDKDRAQTEEERIYLADYEIPTETLPMNILIGGNYEVIKNLTITAQAAIAGKAGTLISAGAEYMLFGVIPLRFGYTNTDNGGIAFGSGFNFNFYKFEDEIRKDVMTMGIDYTYVPFTDIGDTHHIGIKILFK